MTTDEVVARIRKLLRLAENDGATEAEAASAVERANALLIRHNLTMEHVAVSTGEKPPVTEHQVRIGWAGNWRGSLLGILARHSLCSAITTRSGKIDTVVFVGRPINVEAVQAMYDWIAAPAAPNECSRLAGWRNFQRSRASAANGSMGCCTPSRFDSCQLVRWPGSRYAPTVSEPC